MPAASPAGEHSVCNAARIHLANNLVFASSAVHRSYGYKHERSVDLVRVREAGAAHATAPVLHATNRMAVGQHSIGARP
jgi:hypothetical protein